MRWPWKPRAERRSYTSIITQALESATVQTSAARGASAALEVAAGLLARELMGATVEAAPWAKRAVTRDVLAYMGRTCVREGEAVAAITTHGEGRVSLIPVSDHEWHSREIDEEQWTLRGTMSAPDSTVTRTFSRDSVVYLRWSLDALERHRGRGPVSLAGGAATLAQRAEQRLSDEANAPTAHLLPMPEGIGGGDGDDDPARGHEVRDIQRQGRGGSLGKRHGGVRGCIEPSGRRLDGAEGRGNPDRGLVDAAQEAYHRMLSVCGVPPALVNPGSAGTALREAIRHFRMLTVEPFCRCLQDELQTRLATPVALRLDSYALDMVGRSPGGPKPDGRGREPRCRAVRCGGG